MRNIKNQFRGVRDLEPTFVAFSHFFGLLIIVISNKSIMIPMINFNTPGSMSTAKIAPSVDPIREGIKNQLVSLNMNFVRGVFLTLKTAVMVCTMAPILLVALATLGESPKKIKRLRVMADPFPAKVFMIPAKSPPPNNNR